MKKAMESLQDLIEEAKTRTIYWALCIFAVSYFLTHTSKAMLMNIPIAVLLVSGLRILFNKVEFRWKVHNARPLSYLSHLEKKQSSPNDSRLSTVPPPSKWKRNINSPAVEAAMQDFIKKLLQDFVVNLWYSDITPDKEVPELIHAIIMDVLGEVSGRVKEVNLVELLTRDVVDLIGEHLDLFRRNQAAIGVDVMGTLSSEKRDERLKHHLLVSKELHPALISSECEYKVLQRLMSGLLAVVLRPREAQCPLVRCIARELLTCLVMEPIMNFASPVYINELIEYIFLTNKDEGFKGSGAEQSPVHGNAVSAAHGQSSESALRKNVTALKKGTDMDLPQNDDKKELWSHASRSSVSNTIQGESAHQRPSDWARVLEAATQRRTEVLMPENLENMWTIGRNYKQKLQKNTARGPQVARAKITDNSFMPRKDLVTEVTIQKPEKSSIMEDKALIQAPPRPQPDTVLDQDLIKRVYSKRGSIADEAENYGSVFPHENRNQLKKSNSTSDLTVQLNMEGIFASRGGIPIISEFYNPNVSRDNVYSIKSASDMLVRSEELHDPKLRCRVIGAYFEKHGSKSFAVYRIAVMDANIRWFVKRRYRNFERLHRHLKDIPNYTLHLPPKRIFSSSTEDAFVHQRCIQLDKYLQDLLSIANVAEQHEVWDFLSPSSKNYSFEKSSSVMRTLAVNVDDAMDDIARQIKGSLVRTVVGSPSTSHEPASSVTNRNLSWNSDDIHKLCSRQSASESINSFSDNEESEKDVNHGPEKVNSSAQANGWHSDNELDLNGLPPRVVKRNEDVQNLDSDIIGGLRVSRFPEASVASSSVDKEDKIEVPPEWTPPNLSVPVLNLVDKLFLLKRRGWLRRQVFWISKQILQLVMEDAIDDWLLRQIHCLRREDNIAQGIRWIQDVIWPNGTFFRPLSTRTELECQENERFQLTMRQQGESSVSKLGTFEEQLEASRRARDVEKIIFSEFFSTWLQILHMIFSIHV
ncbi:uncharacterized protein LOC111384179 isoform X1 [Olea europaea var. sylvestris]|uniref:uncharacterized protein LOC111384179 isoform X1 n=1 Tax=Olea europaea var. sylvestris TaxID=158386 RepID=UPI000C1D340E|nr:uncharacterized protein LOC111384179 isoform X1 [Olea europaea var. sylvestris]